MSDNDITTPEDGQIDIKAFREAMDAKAKAEAAAAKAERENAMLHAGIPTGTKVGKAFVVQYDGPLDNPEAIRNEAIEWGLFKPEGADPANANEPKTPADQAQVAADRAALDHGGLPPGMAPTPARDVVKEAYGAYRDRLADGGDRQSAFAEVSSRFIDAANKGDERFLVHKWTKEELGYE